MECDYCDAKNVTTKKLGCMNACDECSKERPEHCCPYAMEINEDYETKCTCSKAQEYECSMEI